MSPRFSSNMWRAAEVLRSMDQSDEEERYDEAVFAVHPGFCVENDKYTAVKDLGEDDYMDYTQDFHETVDRTIENDLPVNVVYRENMRDEAVRYLGDKASEVDKFIESSYGNGFTNYNGHSDLGEALNSVSDGGQVVLHGEINGLCLAQFQDLVEEVERGMDRDLDIVHGELFPERPLERTQGHLHWEDEMPAYIQALEFKSPY